MILYDNYLFKRLVWEVVDEDNLGILMFKQFTL